MKQRNIRIEELGLDLKNISDKDLEELAIFIENCLKEELGTLLGERLSEYISTIGVEIANDVINIFIDLEADSYLAPYISLESVLDQVLRHVFERIRNYLVSRYRKTTEVDRKL